MSQVAERIDRHSIGGNLPPGPIEAARPTITDLSIWMQEHPVIETEIQAREAKLLLDRAKACAGDIEDERDRLVRPLNEQIAEINTVYKAVHNSDHKRPGSLDKIVAELKSRLTGFARVEEAKRLAEAERKRREAEEAERIAREAEQRERDAFENARSGELGVDVASVIEQADTAFVGFQRADREAARAERDAQVRIGGGWGKTLTLRTQETLILDDPIQAIRAMGVNEKLRDAILSAARDYRKLHDRLPVGVSAVTERKI